MRLSPLAMLRGLLPVLLVLASSGCGGGGGGGGGAGVALVRDDAYAAGSGVALVVAAASGVLANDLPGMQVASFDATGSAGGTVLVNPDGSFTYTSPPSPFTGVETFTYRARLTGIGPGPLYQAKVSVTVAPPVPIASPGNVFVLEDGGLQGPFQAVATDPDGLPLTWTVGTLPTQSAAFSLDTSSGQFTYQPNPDFFGIDNFSFQVTNTDADVSALATVTVNVVPVNDAPVFTGGGDVAANEDTAVDQAWATGIGTGAANEAGQVLSFVFTANDNPGLFAAGPAVNPATGNLSYTPAAQASGVANVTVELRDDGGTAGGGVDTSAPVSFTITVSPVNDPPTVTAPAGNPPAVSEDAGAQTVVGYLNVASFAPGGGADESGQTLASLVITGNTNPGLFAAGPALAAGSGDLTYTPAASASGSSSITVVARDSGAPAADSGPFSFTITVNSVNDAPVFTGGGNVTTNEDTVVDQVWATGIGPGAANESGQVLSFVVTGNTVPGLFASGPAIDPGTGNLSYTPATDASGSSIVTVELRDDGGTANGGVDTSTPVVFTIAVTAVNDPPTITAPAGDPATVLEDAGAQTVSGYVNVASFAPGGGADESGQTLASLFITGNTNPGLFATGPALAAGSGDLTYTPAADAFGSSMVTAVARDSGAPAADSSPFSFTITVTSVNDEPSFTKGADESVSPSAGSQNVVGWATALNWGASNESGQVLSFNVSNDNNGIFSVQPAVSAAGTLSYTPSGTQGSATVTVSLSDDGGTANGGDDQSPDQTFTITVTNTPPVAPNISFSGHTGNVRRSYTGATGLFKAGGVVTPDADGDTVTVVAATGQATTQSGTVDIGTDGSFTYTPPRGGGIASDTFSYTVTDGTPADNATGTVTINFDGDVWWFVDSSAAGGGDGRSHAPYDSLAALQAVNNGTGTNPKTGHEIFVATGSGADYTGGLTLLASQRLFGQGVDPGIPGFAVTPGAAPKLVNAAGAGVSLASGNTLQGVSLGGSTFALAGASVGDLQVSGVAVSSAGGGLQLAGFAGTPSLSFTSIASSGGTHGIDLDGMIGSFAAGTTTLTGATTRGLEITNSGALTYTFGGTSVSGVTGVTLSTNASATFTFASLGVTSSAGDALVVSNSGTLNVGAGGNIAATGGSGVDLSNTNTSTGMTFGTISSSSGTYGIRLATATGNFTATGAVTITGATGTGVRLESRGSGITAFQSSLGVTSVGVGGALFAQSGGSVTSNGGTLSAANAPVLDMSGTRLGDGTNALLLGALTSTTSVAHGVRLENLTAGSDLQVTGATTVSGSSDEGIRLVSAGAGSTLSFGAVDVDGGLTGILVQNLLGSASFGNTTVDASANAGVEILDTVSASNVSFTGGSIGADTQPGGVGLHVSGLSGTLSIPLGIFKTSGRTVLVENRTGGTVTLGGGVTGNGSTTGILVQNNSGGTVTFSGSFKGLGTSTGAAVTLSNNGGATVEFTGGGLDIDTTSGKGLVATGGGTLRVSGSGNTIDSTTGRALEVDGVSIGTGGLTFQRITSNASAADVGVYLKDTGATAGLTVTGTGAAASGGTIRNKTGSDGSTTSGIGIYLENTRNVSLTRMQLNDFQNFAIRGTGVTGFSLLNSVINGTNGTSMAADEGSVSFDNLLGSCAVTNSSISGGFEDNLVVTNTSGTLNRLTVSGGTIGLNSTASGNDGILVESQNASTLNLTVSGVTFLGARGDLIQANCLGTSTMDVVIRDNTFTNTHSNSLGGGITLSGGSASSNITMTYDVSGTSLGSQTFSGAISNAITANIVNGAGTVTGTIRNNVIGVAATPGSGSSSGSGILIGTQVNTVHNATIADNLIHQTTNLGGIDLNANGSARINADITGNTIDTANGFAFAGIYSSPGGTSQICAHISGNTIDFSATFGFDIYADQVGAPAASYNFPGFTGSATPGTALDTFLAGQNSLNGFGSANNAQNVTGTGSSCVP